MDRRTLLAVILSLTLYYTWLMLRSPQTPPEAELPVVEEAPPGQPAPAAAAGAAPTTSAPSRELTFAACDLEAVVHTDGGGLADVHLPQEEGPYDITPIWRWLANLPFADEWAWHPYGEVVPPEPLTSPVAHALVSGTGNPAASDRRFEVVRSEPALVELRSVGADGVEVRQVLQGGAVDPCLLQLDVTWSHHGAKPVAAGDLWVGIFDAIDPPSGMFAMYENHEQAVTRADADLEHGAWTEPAAGALHVPERLDGTSDWIGLADRYHGLFALPVERTGTAAWARYPAGEAFQNGVIWSPPGALEPGATVTASFRVFAGPHDTDVLANVDETLVEIVDFGIFAVFAYPLLFLLRLLEGLVGNWGLAIVALTVTVRAAFFPLNQSAFRSAEKMKLVQPMLNEIREKYKDDQEEQNRRTLEVFREHKVNPVGGCLPMLIQMPVFLALFYVLMYSSDLYHTEFLYLRDLSSPDPWGLLPTVVVGLMFVQQQLTPMGNMDPAQQRMMQIMPLLFGFFWYMFPSGLVVYYFVNTGLGILQQWWIRRSFATTTPGTVA